MLPQISGPQYVLDECERWTRRSGLYNSYALFVAWMWILWWADLCPLWLCCLQSASLGGALAIDDRCVERRSALNPILILQQLRLYSQLCYGLVSDFWLMWLLPGVAFAVFWRVHDSWRDFRSVVLLGSDIICGYYGEFLYAVYQSFRVAFLVVALVWDGARHHCVSRRHLLWSYLIGNIGLVVRCFRYDAIKWVGRKFAHALPNWVALDGTAWWSHLGFAAVVMWISWGQLSFNFRDNYLFYKVRPTIHSGEDHTAQRATLPLLPCCGNLNEVP
jgi:hypothetical protein